MESISTRPTWLKWGLILGGVSLVMSIISFTMTDPAEMAKGSTMQTVISFATVAGILFLAIREYRTLNGGHMTLGQGFIVGLMVSLVGGLISAILGQLYISMFQPDFYEIVGEAAREQALVQNPDLTDEQLEMMEGMMSWTTSPVMIIIFGVIGSGVMGAIAGLIISAILKKDPDPAAGLDDFGQEN